MLHRLIIALAAVGACLSQPAHAQDYPVRPITVLVGLAPGGVTDILSRIYAAAVSQTLGQTVVVENRPAASGAIAAAALQKAQPDGYTLLIFSGSQHATIPAIEPNPIYDPIKGQQPIALLSDIATVLTVPVMSPANSFAELIELGKKKPGGLNFGSPGVGTPSHLTAAKLMAATKTPVEYAHYRGGAPMMADLLTGRLDAAIISTPLGKPYLLDKKLKPLALDAAARWSVIPHTPTLTELGFGDASVARWFGVSSAPGTARPIIQKLHAAFSAAGRDPAVRQRIEDLGLTVNTSTPEEMQRMVEQETENIRKLVQALGLRKQ
jgi:tripartite-type tricarboxylate transporter receptor subunit TctC